MTETLDPIEPTSDDLDPAALPVCPICLHEVTPKSDFCPKCNAPVSRSAVCDPLQAVYSTGWLYRRSIGDGMSTIAFVGMWLIFGPLLLLCAVSLLELAFWQVGSADYMSWLLLLAASLLNALILERVTRSYIRFRRRKPGHCAKCQYSLAHLTVARCPECGTRFDPERVALELEDADLPESK